MRSVHPTATPVVALEASAMPTRYGRKSKPVFKIVDWNATDTGNKEDQIIEHAAPLTLSDDEECPF
jgi:hypothetical protein